jgi:hypothetical protein
MATPDFEQIAQRILGDAVVIGRRDALTIAGAIVEALRQVWNARGAADHDRLLSELAREEPGLDAAVVDTIHRLDC